MSFCRWSSDDFSSDVYCYEDCMGGFTTWVASHKYVGDIPKLPNIGKVTNEEFFDAYQKQMDFLKTAESEPIGLPHDGDHFNDETLGELRARLLVLQELGYRVPQFAVEAIESEIAGDSNA